MKELLKEYRKILFEERREINRRLTMIKNAKKEAQDAIKEMSEKIKKMDEIIDDGGYIEELKRSASSGK